MEKKVRCNFTSSHTHGSAILPPRDNQSSPSSPPPDPTYLDRNTGFPKPPTKLLRTVRRIAPPPSESRTTRPPTTSTSVSGPKPPTDHLAVAPSPAAAPFAEVVPSGGGVLIPRRHAPWPARALAAAVPALSEHLPVALRPARLASRRPQPPSCGRDTIASSVLRRCSRGCALGLRSTAQKHSQVGAGARGSRGRRTARPRRALAGSRARALVPGRMILHYTECY